MEDVPVAPAVARPRWIGGRLNSVHSQARSGASCRLYVATIFAERSIPHHRQRTLFNPKLSWQTFIPFFFVGEPFLDVRALLHALASSGKWIFSLCLL